MPHPHRKLVALVVGVSLLAAGPLGSAQTVRAADPVVTVDLSLGNGIATGSVIDPDPDDALVIATNHYHFWAGLDLQPAGGAATLAPAPLGRDARGIYGLLGLVGPEASSAWAGTFGPAGGSQSVWIHYDLATTRGAQALALTTLTIVADTFGAPLLAPSAAAVQHAVTLITDLGQFSELLAAVQRNDPWATAQQWSLLLQSAPGRAAIIEALADLGVLATDAGLKALGTVVGLIDFAQTLADLLRAGTSGHTSGQVTFSASGADLGLASGTPGASASASAGEATGYSAASFTRIASLYQARSMTSGVTLEDGRVLVVGGVLYGKPTLTDLAESEVYDEGTGTWQRVDNMGSPREEAALTLLGDGRVLVTGGIAGGRPMASAELFDPSTGKWTATGDMQTPRAAHTATLLHDGRVLVAGGWIDQAGTRTSTAEIYDPDAGSWTSVTGMQGVRAFALGQVLNDGRVVVIGGEGEPSQPPYLNSAEIFDVARSAWQELQPMSVGRDDFAASMLEDGRLLVAGGRDYQSSNTGLSAELLDPASGTWTSVAPMTSARVAPSATLLGDGNVVVIGGDQVGTAEVYDVASGSWQLAGAIGHDLWDHIAARLPDDRVLVAGGAIDNNGTGTDVALIWSARP